MTLLQVNDSFRTAVEGGYSVTPSGAGRFLTLVVVEDSER